MATEQSTRYIFLVDDEPIQNEMLKDYIAERFQYKIKTYENGESAMKDLNLEPEIVVLDYHLNSSQANAADGVAVLKQIKEKNPHTQVIMLSGQDKLDVAVESMKHGAYDYVIKGETAFSRMENVLNNINELSNARQANTSYKKVITSLFVAIAVLVVISVVLVLKLK